MKSLIITSLSVLALTMMFTGCGGGSASSSTSDNQGNGQNTVNNGSAAPVVKDVKGLTQFPAVPAVPEQ